MDDTTLASTVEFGVGDSRDQRTEALTFAYVSGFNQNGVTVRMHEAHLCNLTPDTEYSYRVGGESPDQNGWSQVLRFRTAPDPVAQPDAEVSIAVVGDSRGGYEIWQTVVNLLAQESPDLILFSGDAVTIGAVQVEWETFFNAAQPLFSQAPVISAHGNHDVNSITYFSQFALPGNEENFDFRFGPVHVVVANDSPELVASIEGATASYLREALPRATAAPWSLFMHHKPMWSATLMHGSDEALRAAWGPIVDDSEIDLVVNGHEHAYERTKPLRRGSVVAPKDGTVYVVAGGGGADLYVSGAEFWTEVSESTHGAGIIRARRGSLEFRAVRADGTALDAFTLTKPAN